MSTASRLPNETSEYRAARERLLEAEVALRRQMESVAELRRKLPLGGKVPEDYVFEGAGGPVRLSELFTRGDTLVAYSFMYGPNMEHACPLCTSMLDGLDGEAPHIREHVSLVVIAKSPIARIMEHAGRRGWSDLTLLSSHDNDYNRDYLGEAPDGSQLPMLNVFVKDDGAIRHFYATELLFAKNDAGKDARHIDLLWPLWQVLDLTPGGRGTGWYPKLQY
ncbi:MAG TPA: DUF899 family protein [Candidatus Limnocylindrales bacterium]|nr:DUF899 family protein [Candidatus Limnocylindrales bacterium]